MLRAVMSGLERVYKDEPDGETGVQQATLAGRAGEAARQGSDL
jgi:hypothetical protein